MTTDSSAFTTIVGRPREQIREVVTMALYISLSLLSVMIALPDEVDPSNADQPVLTVALTSAGLILAHALAFRLSTRLVDQDERLPLSDQLLAQLAGGLGVTLLATLPMLMFGPDTGASIAEVLLVGIIVVVGYLAARSAAMSRPKAFASVAVVAVIGALVLWVKALVPH